MDSEVFGYFYSYEAAWNYNQAVLHGYGKVEDNRKVTVIIKWEDGTVSRVN